MYIHLWYNYRGGGAINLVSCKFLKILMVSDKIIHKAFRLHKTLYKQIHLRKFGFSPFKPTLYFFFKLFGSNSCKKFNVNRRF